MENRTKKILSVVLAVVMVVSMLPIFAMADEVDEKYDLGDTFTSEDPDAELPTFESGAVPKHTHWENRMEGTEVTCGEEAHTHGDMCAREKTTAEDSDFDVPGDPIISYFVCTDAHSETEGAHEGGCAWAETNEDDFFTNIGNPGYMMDSIPGDPVYHKWTCETPVHDHAAENCPTVQTYTWTLAANEWIEAKVYLLLAPVNGEKIPSTINQGFNVSWFGPSRENTPYFVAKVDITMLEENIKRETKGSQWFVSVDNAGYKNTADKPNGREAQVKQIWGWIYDAMDANSQQAFTSTFGPNAFVGYVLKLETDGVHIDGVLNQEPPLYHYDVMDLSLKTAAVNDTSTSKFTATNIKDKVNGYLKSTYGANDDSIDWTNYKFTAGTKQYTFTFKAMEGRGGINFGKNEVTYVETASESGFRIAGFDLTVTAVPTYKVTYMVNYELGDFTQHGVADELYEGDGVEIRDEVVESGYKFSGWYTDENLTEKAKPFTMETTDVTFYGNLMPTPQYTIEYKVQVDGTDAMQLMDTQDVMEDEDGTAYSFNVPEGHSFSGWYSDDDCTEPVTPNLTNVKEDMVFYGKTTINNYEYTINYYKDEIAPGNLIGDPIKGTEKFGETVTADNMLRAPEGYATPGTGVNQITIGTDSSKNVINIVYGKENYGYTINYYKDSIDGEFLGTKTESAPFGTSFKVEIIDPEIDDFLPTGYAAPGVPDKESIVISTNADENVINVVYSKAIYNIQYYLDNVLITELNNTAKYEEQVGVAEKPAKTGHTVSDWSSNDVTLLNGEFTMPAKDVKIYATSTAIDYTVTYVDDNGTTVLQTAKTVRTGDSVPEYKGATPTKAPDDMIYTFSKWTLIDGALIDGKVGETNLIYQASYLGVDAGKYSVFYTNGFDENSSDYVFHVLEKESYYTYETYIPLTDSETLGFTKPGHTFEGWELRDGCEVLGNEENGYSGKGGSVIFYDAVWEKIPYTLMVTKTVIGAELPVDFYIELTSEELEESVQMDMRNYDEFDEDSNTYMWIVDGLFIGDYTATEYNYEIAGYNRTGTTSDSARLEGPQDLGAEIDGLIALSNIYSSPNSPTSSYSLTVNHIGMDEEGNPQLLDKEGPVSGYALGAPYDTSDRAFDGWSLYGMSEGSAPIAGSIAGDTTVTYIYALNADILEEGDPLSDAPDSLPGDEVVVILDPDDPLAPGTIVIPDDPAPLSDAPQTGDNNNIALMIAVMAACAMGIVVLNIPKKKRAQG